MPSITVPSVIAAGVGAAGAIGGSMIQSSAVNSAAKKSAAAAADSLAVQKQQFADTTANNKPFLTTGTSALNQLAGMYGLNTTDANGNTVPGSPASTVDPNATFYQTPDYKFAMQQGLAGVDAGAAAGGSLDSGATRKAEIGYASNLASGTFNSYADRLQQLAGVGQSAANSQAGAGSNYASNYSNTVQGAAADQANAGLVSGAGYADAINNLAGQAQYALGKNPFASSYNPVPNGSVGSGYGGTNYGGTGVLY